MPIFKSATEELRYILGTRPGKPIPFTEFQADALLRRAGAIEDMLQSPIDLKSELDSSISYEENRGHLIVKYGYFPEEFERDRKELEEQRESELEIFREQEKEEWLDPLYNNDPDAIEKMRNMGYTKEEIFKEAYEDGIIKTKKELKHYLSGPKEEEGPPPFDEGDTVTYTDHEGKNLGIGMVYDFKWGGKGRYRLGINFPMVADGRSDTMHVWSDDPGLILTKKSTDKSEDIEEWYHNWEELSKELKSKDESKIKKMDYTEALEKIRRFIKDYPEDAESFVIDTFETCYLYKKDAHACLVEAEKAAFKINAMVEAIERATGGRALHVPIPEGSVYVPVGDDIILTLFKNAKFETKAKAIIENPDIIKNLLHDLRTADISKGIETWYKAEPPTPGQMEEAVLEYYKADDGYSNITITARGIFTVTIVTKREKGVHYKMAWEERGTPQSISRQFKTLNQAHTFAIKWMKEHPRPSGMWEELPEKKEIVVYSSSRPMTEVLPGLQEYGVISGVSVPEFGIPMGYGASLERRPPNDVLERLGLYIVEPLTTDEVIDILEIDDEKYEIMAEEIDRRGVKPTKDMLIEDILRNAIKAIKWKRITREDAQRVADELLARAKKVKEEKVEKEEIKPKPPEGEGILKLNQRIYYTGDMANVSGFGHISEIEPSKYYGVTYDVIMDDGRVFKKLSNVDFEKGVGQRFKTIEQYNQERKEALERLEKRMKEVAPSAPAPAPAPKPKPKVPPRAEEKKKEPWEMVQKEFVDAYYEQYKQTKLAEEKPQLIDALKNAKQAYEEAIKTGHPRVAASEKRGIELFERQLEANLKGTFTDPESVHLVILHHLLHDHAEFVKKALDEGKPVPSQVREEYPALISVITLKESLETCINIMHEAVEKHSKSPFDRISHEFDDILTGWNELGIEEQKEICRVLAPLMKEENKDLLSKAMLVSGGAFAQVYKKCREAGLLKETPEIKPAPAPKPEVPPKAEEKKKPTVEARVTIPIPIKASDINYDLAVAAYAGTSFSPEERAAEEQQAYLDHIESVYNELLPYAKTDGQKRVLESELTRYASEYAKRRNDILSSRSRIISPMIAGPSKFPIERMRKLSDALDKKERKFIEWAKRAIGSIKKGIKQASIEERGGEVAVMEEELKKLEEGLERMKEMNKIIRKKGLTDEQKLDLLIKAGINEKMARKALSPEFKGIPGYELTSIRDKIKTRKHRIEELKAKELKKGYEVVKEFSGGNITKNYDIDRVQIFFDEIPPEEVRTELKSHGWHWSPTNEAWQRKITGDAEYSANEIIKRFYEMEEEAPPAPKVPPKPEEEAKKVEKKEKIEEKPPEKEAPPEVPSKYKEIPAITEKDIESLLNFRKRLAKKLEYKYPEDWELSILRYWERYKNPPADWVPPDFTIAKWYDYPEDLRKHMVKSYAGQLLAEHIKDAKELSEIHGLPYEEKPLEKKMPKKKTIKTEKGFIETFEVCPIEEWDLSCGKVKCGLDYCIEGLHSTKKFETFDSAHEFLKKGEGILYRPSSKRDTWATWVPIDIKPFELEPEERFEFEFGKPPVMCIYKIKFAVFRSEDKKWEWHVDIYDKETGILKSEEYITEEKMKDIKRISEEKAKTEEKPREEEEKEVPTGYEGSLETCINAITEAIENDIMLPIQEADYDFYIIADQWGTIGRDEQEEICSAIRPLLKDEKIDLLDEAMKMPNFAEVYDRCDEAGLLEEVPVKAPPPEPKEIKAKVKPKPPRKKYIVIADLLTPGWGPADVVNLNEMIRFDHGSLIEHFAVEKSTVEKAGGLFSVFKYSDILSRIRSSSSKYFGFAIVELESLTYDRWESFSFDIQEWTEERQKWISKILEKEKKKEKKKPPAPPEKVEKPPAPKPKPKPEPKHEKPPAEAKKEEIEKRERKEEIRDKALEGWIKNQLESAHPEVNVSATVLEDTVQIRGVIKPDHEKNFMKKVFSVVESIGAAHIAKKEFGEELEKIRQVSTEKIKKEFEEEYPETEIFVELIDGRIEITGKIRPEYKAYFLKERADIPIIVLGDPNVEDIARLKKEFGEELDKRKEKRVERLRPKIGKEIVYPKYIKTTFEKRVKARVKEMAREKAIPVWGKIVEDALSGEPTEYICPTCLGISKMSGEPPDKQTLYTYDWKYFVCPKCRRVFVYQPPPGEAMLMVHYES